VEFSVGTRVDGYVWLSAGANVAPRQQEVQRVAAPPTSNATTTGAAEAARRLRSGKITPAKTAPPGMDKLKRVQDDIDDATDMMRQNLEQVVGRGEHLELLVDKSDAFSANARAFQKDTTTLKRAMWWKNMKMIFMMIALLLSIGLMWGWFKCGWTFAACRSKAPVTADAAVSPP
jgi:hypothetical protein